MGRGIFMRGRHATPEAAPAGPGVGERLKAAASPVLEVPLDAPGWLLNNVTIRAFNEAYFRKQLKPRTNSVVHYEPFFFPLDFVRDWNRLYGPRGFLQYQLVVPPDPEHRAIRTVLEQITASGMGSFLAVIKEFGERVHGGLSFPAPGVTLALDFPNYGQPLFELLDRLDDVVAEAGGRVYLCKDARLKRAQFRRMYPEWESWRAVRDRWDPDGVFQSELGRRLGLVPAQRPQAASSGEHR
jgi:decaprenylphospho-beta-D-ribofuranose 2-oxidase